MGKDTVSFSCHHCSHCCTEVVCLPTPWDVRRIAKMEGKEVEDFVEFLTPEEVDSSDEEDPTWLDVNGDKYMMALKRDEKTGCTFLNKKTKYCTIYEARPLLCRLYPFELVTNKNGSYKEFRLHDDVGCPKFTDEVYQTGPLYDLAMQDELNHEDYCELVEIFNAKEYENKDPEDFILLFTGGVPGFDEAVSADEEA